MIQILNKMDQSFTGIYIIRLFLFILSGTQFGLCQKSELNQPPVMTEMPPALIYYKYGETVVMPCRGYGSGKLDFTWEKDAIPFQPRGHDDRMVQLANEGTIVINFPEDKDEGFYKCFIKNLHGVAMSSAVKLQPGRLEQFKQKPPQSHEVRLGDSIKLDCTPPTSTPQPNITWVIHKNRGSVIVKDDNHLTIDRDGNLHILSVRKSDYSDGDPYRCMVLNEFMRSNAVGEEHYLTIIGDKPIKKPPDYMFSSQLEVSSVIGSTVHMKCVYGGSPIPIISWIKNQGSVDSIRHKKKSFGMAYVIEDVQKSDEGQYECQAKNSASPIVSSKSFIVKIGSRPEWVSKPQDLDTTTRRNVSFVCAARGDPLPEETLWQDGVLMESKPRGAIVTRHSTGNIKVVQIQYNNINLGDNRVIQCNMSNPFGFIYTNFYLNIMQEAPRIIIPPLKLAKFAEGSPATLFCHTAGKPEPVVSWFKDQRPMTGGRYKILRNGNLLIKRATLSDSGHYQCTATNMYGKVEGEGSLIVRRRTRLVQTPFDVQVNEGTPAKFTCAATTDPLEEENLKTLWFKDGLQVLPDSQRMTFNYQDNSLTVTDTNPRDSGSYQCVATNGIDNATAVAMLLVKGRPSKPVNVKLTVGSCTQRSVSVEWSSGGNNYAPISKFIVEYNSSASRDLWVAREIKANLFKTKIQLSAGATYTFRVRAVNKIGISVPSKPTSPCIIQPGPPDKHPDNVRTIGDTKGHLIIEWTPMPEIEQNAKGFEYIIRYRRDGVSAFTTDTVTNAEQSRWSKALDDSTTPYQKFIISVSARNTEGSPSVPVKEVIGYSGEEEPTLIPQNIMALETNKTSTEIILEWDNIDTSDVTQMKGEFRGFKVQYWRENAKRTTFREQILLRSQYLKTCTRGKICIKLTQLIPYTTMTAQVVIINNFYMGPPSNLIQFTTKEGLPGPVKSLRVEVAGPNHFDLRWEEPDDEDKNGIIMNYDIAYQTVKKLTLGKLKDRDGEVKFGEVTAKLSGLLPDTKYRVHLWARTKYGRGEDYYIEYDTTSATGDIGAPSFKFLFIGEHTMNISWYDYATSGKRIGTIFFVEYRKDGLSDWQKSPDEMVKYHANISSLESGTTYEVRVVTTDGDIYKSSHIQKATTSGVGAVYVPSAGWFLGMLILIIILVIVIIVIIVLVKYFHFTFDCCPQARDEKVEHTEMTAHGAYHKRDTAMEQRRGYYNEDYPRPYGVDDHDGIRRPPSYSDIDSYQGEPGKFDEHGTPRMEIRDPRHQQQHYDDDRYSYPDDGRYPDYPDDDRPYDDRYYDDDFEHEPHGGHTPSHQDDRSLGSFV